MVYLRQLLLGDCAQEFAIVCGLPALFVLSGSAQERQELLGSEVGYPETFFNNCKTDDYFYQV